MPIKWKWKLLVYSRQKRVSLLKDQKIFFYVPKSMKQIKYNKLKLYFWVTKRYELQNQNSPCYLQRKILGDLKTRKRRSSVWHCCVKDNSKTLCWALKLFNLNEFMTLQNVLSCKTITDYFAEAFGCISFGISFKYIAVVHNSPIIQEIQVF